MRACFINECVRRWLWGIRLLQRLRVPPGFPRFPRMPVVMLLQLGAPTLCLRKRTSQSHLLFVGNSVCLIASYGVAGSKPGFRINLFEESRYGIVNNEHVILDPIESTSGEKHGIA